ncbi:hypothetical protein KJY73_03005 [Bowmanella sp. Y26]|uniref:hypothetical protein n=1 Tax=Bowmanella yangjiangensis TaxID=2811230 RepID=UPI001BDC11F8|nr:hypothetical protein [Bowmanella yangjiangensis]MBT1062523.1 hypothetical protein [Bowmanella yangjiangensis]
MQWYVVSLGDALVAQSKMYELQEVLNLAWQGAGRPSSMQAGYCYRGQGLHCQIDLYLSEPLQLLVSLPRARRCESPTADFQSLLGDSPSAMA